MDAHSSDVDTEAFDVQSHYVDTVFDLLRDRRRRYVLYALDDADGSVVPLEDVVEAVLTYEAAVSETGERPPGQVVRTNLVHEHLPRLSSAGVIERNARTGEIRVDAHPLLDEWLGRVRPLEHE